MLEKIILTVVVIAAGYWYWSGPYQEKNNSSHEQMLQENAENIARCLHGAAYKLGATGVSSGNAEEQCAKKYNLYKHEGQWYSYDKIRPTG